MSKNYSIAAIIGIVIAVAIGYAVVMNKKTGDGTEQAVNPGTKQARSLQDLMQGGQSGTCSFEVSDEGTKSAGRVYYAEGKVRGDFTSTVSATGENVETHMVQKEGMVYVWTSAAPFGFKGPAGAAAGQPPQGQYSFDYSGLYHYDCSAWSPESGAFEVPTDIQFMDGQNIMPQ